MWVGQTLVLPQVGEGPRAPLCINAQHRARAQEGRGEGGFVIIRVYVCEVW